MHCSKDQAGWTKLADGTWSLSCGYLVALGSGGGISGRQQLLSVCSVKVLGCNAGKEGLSAPHRYLLHWEGKSVLSAESVVKERPPSLKQDLSMLVE